MDYSNKMDSSPVKDRNTADDKYTGNKPSVSVWAVLGSVAFYIMIALIVYGAYRFARNEDASKSIFGYRPYTILTPSMRSVYPVGSMVIVKLMPPQELEIGDDITFYYPDNPAVPVWTHRIIEILPDYHGYGISFRTKGVNNREPDPFVTLGGNVVGKVKFCIPYAGLLATFVMDHTVLSLGFLMFFCIFILLVGDLLQKTPEIPRWAIGSDEALMQQAKEEAQILEKKEKRRRKKQERKLMRQERNAKTKT